MGKNEYYFKMGISLEVLYQINVLKRAYFIGKLRYNLLAKIKLKLGLLFNKYLIIISHSPILIMGTLIMDLGN